MNGLQLAALLKKYEGTDYDHVCFCLSDCEEIIMPHGSTAKIDIQNDVISFNEDYKDTFSEWDMTHNIIISNICNVRFEKKKDWVPRFEESFIAEDYHKDLEDGYEMLLNNKKINAKMPQYINNSSLTHMNTPPLKTYYG